MKDDGQSAQCLADPDTQFQFSILHCEVIFVTSLYKWYL